MSICTSWGRYPKISCNYFYISNQYQLEEILKKEILKNNVAFISRGNGRSYGDSALSSNIVDITPKNYFLDFDESTGLLHVQAGVLLSEIVDLFVPRGWFLPVTPGTGQVTVGGAIASDVHGKNHHIDGCFSNWVKEFDIMLPNGSVVTCNPQITPDLWHATCGGMGLTGTILSAKLYLRKIKSAYIKKITIKAKNLTEMFELFEKYSECTYSVAWIDSTASERELGRGLFMLGEFESDGNLNRKRKNKISLNVEFPDFIINKYSVNFFNYLYYNKIKDKYTEKRVILDDFFYPLDTIGNWNLLYGKNGFLQYQFILPYKNSYDGIKEVLRTISNAGKASTLAVLKLCGEENKNWLSFPKKGYSLALDFKIEKGIFSLLEKLDSVVTKYNGRIYLAKDSRVSKNIFEQGYNQIEKFRNFRKENGMNRVIQSLQSQRVEI